MKVLAFYVYRNSDGVHIGDSVITISGKTLSSDAVEQIREALIKTVSRNGDIEIVRVAFTQLSVLEDEPWTLDQKASLTVSVMCGLSMVLDGISGHYFYAGFFGIISLIEYLLFRRGSSRDFLTDLGNLARRLRWWK